MALSLFVLCISNIYLGVSAENSMTMYYRFDEDTVSKNEEGKYIIRDLSGKGNDATATNDSSFKDNAIQGEFTIPKEAFVDTTSFTMNFCMTSNLPGIGRPKIVDFGAVELFSAWGSGIGRLCSYMENGTEVYAPQYMSGMNVQEMNMYTIVKNDSSIQVYFNGAPLSETWANRHSTINLCDTVSEDVIVTTELMDEFSFYNSVLTDEQIAKLYNNLNTTPTPIPIPTPGHQTVTIEPPTVDVNSGVVPYGTKVTLSPTTAHLAYSINGGAFVHEYSVTSVTITEDTTIVVKSWVDAFEPNTTYLTPEATYTYTVSKDYNYQISDISLSSSSGEELNTIPENSGFVVDVTVEEIENRDSKDYMFVTVYGTDGSLLSMDYVRADFKVNNSCSFGFYIPAQKAEIGSIKAYVWNTFASMIPLSESKTFEIEN